jgi:hypothetical protein
VLPREASLERDLRVALDVEEVRAAQVVVAVLLARPDAGGVDLAAEAGGERLVQVELQLTVDVLEQPADPGDHHVPGPELGLAVARLEIQADMARTLLR